MKKTLIAALAILSVNNFTTAQFAAVVNGQVVRQGMSAKQDPIAAKLSNFAKTHGLQGSQSPKQYTQEELKVLITSRALGNNVVAVYVTPVESYTVAVSNPKYNAYIFRKSEYAGFDKSALKDLTLAFKELAKNSQNFIVRTNAGTNATGELIALYANPEVAKDSRMAGKPLDVIEIRSK